MIVGMQKANKMCFSFAVLIFDLSSFKKNATWPSAALAIALS